MTQNPWPKRSVQTLVGASEQEKSAEPKATTFQPVVRLRRSIVDGPADGESSVTRAKRLSVVETRIRTMRLSCVAGELGIAMKALTAARIWVASAGVGGRLASAAGASTATRAARASAIRTPKTYLADRRASDGEQVALPAMDVQMITEGLWRWTARHPDWAPGKDWPEDVGCVYYEAPQAVVLIDPLVPADEAERFWRALDRDVEGLGRPVVVLVTVGWHERSVDTVSSRYGATVWRHGDGGPLPDGVRALPVEAAEETVFWLPEHAALVPGDVLLEEDGLRLCPASWLPDGRTLDEVREALAPAPELPVERVLVSLGRPLLAGGSEALAATLAAPPA